MVAPVTLTDLAFFLQNVFRAYESYVLMAFTLMLTMSIALGVKRLMVGRYS